MSPVTDAPATTNRGDDLGSAGGVRGLLWLTWRQHRWALLGTLVLAAVLVGWMVYLSAEMTDLYHQCHNMRCPQNSPQDQRLSANPFGLFRQASYTERLVQYMPLLIGMFIGVPVLSREHEQRTLLLAWSQDVSPARWLWTKLGLLGLFVAAVTAAVAGVSDHLEHVWTNVGTEDLFRYEAFLATGMLPVAISIGWFAVGVALGAAIRRTLPAAFGVIVGFIGLMLFVQFRYPTLMKPLSAHLQMGGPDSGLLRHNALVVTGGMIRFGIEGPSGAFDTSGRQLSGVDLQRLCPPVNDFGKMLSCFSTNHLQQHLQYQPGSRIPDFHLIVATGYLGLTAMALAAVWWLVRRTDLSAG
ncbi:ABC transporter permease [Planosporangium thailandense]|uniref:ABC transporter permease n=1 Tax=Planosporangium thailandense TaxID=765197 RepID=A0ABX0Y213_9ACTN|nr:ABC transporter permease [Planosporangium thailandense]NJC72131.1 ABC transporter permease [Planosporangium thailandense]